MANTFISLGVHIPTSDLQMVASTMTDHSKPKPTATPFTDQLAMSAVQMSAELSRLRMELTNAKIENQQLQIRVDSQARTISHLKETIKTMRANNTTSKGKDARNACES